ncbi:MAG: hypothetical protein NTW25_13375, partial [Candidatus Kapabacteria bacterium]|nr:hypothetical protein [Candidatus Kapabacteria bacterium]
MKYLIILILTLNILQAQDREPSILKFTYKINGTTFTNVPLNRDSIKPKNFVISTQWGGHPNMLHALKFNYTEDKSITPTPNKDTNSKINYIWQISDSTTDPLTAKGFIYEPTLKIDSTNPDKFKPKPNDTTKAIWGFRTQFGKVLDTTNVNYDRLVLYHDSANSNPSDKIVLNNSWINNKLYYYSNDYTNETNSGIKWNFSINLRRLDSTEIRDNTNGNDTLLVIRLPYVKKKLIDSTIVSSPGFIKFSQIPSTNLKDTIHLNYYENLGTALKMDSIPNTTSIVILNKMITDKLRLDSGYKKDITINAEFICNDSSYNNPMLKVLYGTTLGIDVIDIEVKYYGKHDIAIDWLSIGTPEFRNVFEGKHDLPLHDRAQKLFQTMSDSGYNVSMFYGTDEHSEDHFNSNRRLLRLFNFNSTIEGAGGAHPKQFAYHEEVKNIWDGSPSFVKACFLPYVRTQALANSAEKYRLSFTHGFGGDDVIKDTNNSKYETYLRPRSSITPDKIWRDFHKLNLDSISGQEYSDNTIFKGFEYYNAILKVGFSAQALLEIYNYNQFYSGNSHIYDHKAWFQNFYFGADWNMDTTTIPHGKLVRFPYYRPQTGEESRWNIWRALIYGAKGLTYDGHCEFVYKNINGKVTGFGGPKTLQFLNNDLNPNRYDTASVETLLFSNNSVFGTDFIQNPDEGTGIHYGINFDSTSNVLGVPKNRIYYGRKSPKIEMYKAHSFIKQPDIEDILLKLQIVSAIGKGYRLWHNWDIANYGSNDPMKRILNFDTVHIIYDAIDTNKSLCSNFIRTRPIERLKDGQAFYEPWDSSFFDLTLHKYNNQNLDTTFIVGLQNRRTDPLIMADFSSYNQMYFSPSAEFEKAVLKGDSIYPYTSDTSLTRVWKDSTWWRNKYWKKLGCREITIPFNFKLQSDTNKYCLLHVKELYDSTSYSVNLRNATNTKLIDTIIGQDSPLALNFQPGEGKFFFFFFLEQQKNIVGELDYSNQNKMVIWKDSAMGNTFSYHIAFYKKDIIVKSGRSIPLNRVYYARSKTFKGQMDLANIDWYDIKPISNNITDRENHEIDTFDCAFPSIIVRKDTNNLAKAYIVYQCRDTNITLDAYNLGRIVETILDVTGTYTSSFVSSKEVATFAFPILAQYEDYGNPVINASKDGNFYSWSAISGIISGFKKPNTFSFDESLEDTLRNFTIRTSLDDSGNMQHPSLNPYSIIFDSTGRSENQASLVFQSENVYPSTQFVYFTRLKVDNPDSKVRHFLMPNISSTIYPKGSAFKLFDSDRIAKFLWGARKGALATVYRSLKYSGVANVFRYEVIAWERRYDSLNSQIFALNILDRYSTTSSDSLTSWRVNTYAHLSPTTGNNMNVGKPTLGNPTEIDRTDYFNPKVRGESVL